MAIFSAVAMSLLLIVAYGWELRITNPKVVALFNGVLSICLWYTIGLFGYSLYSLGLVSDFNDLINNKLEYIIYIIAIFGVVAVSILKKSADNKHY